MAKYRVLVKPSAAKELESTIKAISSLKREEILLNEKFTLNCLPVLGAEKTRRLLGVERQFRKKLMEELKERRKDKPGQRRR